jgi:iron complex outermembrane recepter protein
MGTNLLRALFLTSAGLAHLATAAPAAALAQEASYQIDIPAQPMGEALRALGKATKQNIVFDGSIVKGKRSTTVRGRMSASEALDRMLQGSGLEMSRGSGGGLVVKARNALSDESIGSNEIVVTGTRLGNATVFTSVAPVQVVDADKARAGGQTTAGAILQSSPQVSGPRNQLRYNQEFAGSIYDGGPGTQTLALRGFTSAQTLLLVNGRRLPPSGVEGVPRSPDLGLIPSSIVQRYEILTDGASPVYGSDAIAGIVNVILKQDYDGLTIDASTSVPEIGAARENIVSASFGKTFSSGYFGIAAEYRNSNALNLGDRRFFGLDCQSYYDRDGSGQIVEFDRVSAGLPGTPLSPCISNNSNFFTGRFIDVLGIEYRSTPGRSNVGVPYFSVDAVPGFLSVTAPQYKFVQFDSDGNGRIDAPVFDEFGQPTGEGDAAFPDPDGNGLVDVDIKSPQYDFSRQSGADLVSPLRQFSLYAHARYDTGVAGDASLFLEGSFNRRESDVRLFGVQRRLAIPASNPFNPCGVEGVDCTGYFGDLGPSDVFLYQNIRGDGDRASSRINQYRFVIGFEGKLPFLNGGSGFLAREDWSYEISALHARTNGFSIRRGIRNDRLDLAINAVRDPGTGQIVCGTDLVPGEQACVPVNLFAANVQIDRKLSAQEENYLFDDLAYRTKTDLTVINAFARGKFGILPSGAISWVLGAEFRQDGIDAGPTDQEDVGRFDSFNLAVDRGADGSRKTTDFFGEIGLPLIRNKPLFDELFISLAGRTTRTEFTGRADTYSVKGRWALADWLAIRGSYGSSFRSPSPFELFLKPFQRTDFVFDPCVVPTEARDPITNTYVPALDPRTNRAGLLDTCRSQGVDPTSLGLDQSFLTRALISTGGATDDLRPERSTSWTVGAVLDVPLAMFGQSGLLNGLGLRLSATYYNLRVRDRIEFGDLFGVLGRCYFPEAGTEIEYCNRIDRAENGFIRQINLNFINRSEQRTAGIDFNALLSKSFDFGSERVRASLDVAGNYEFDNIVGVRGGFEDRSGLPTYPKLKLSATAQVAAGDWLFTWFSRYVGPSGRNADDVGFDAGTPTCVGADRELCRPVNRIDDYFLHNMSIARRIGTFIINFGVNNVFNNNPPRVSPFLALTGVTNTPLNGNYDVYGRTFLLQFQKSF